MPRVIQGSSARRTVKPPVVLAKEIAAEEPLALVQASGA
jgi:hypothetical protein